MSKNNVITAGLGRAVAALLLLTVIVSLTFVTTGCSKKFDYMTADLDEYIEFTEDYKNFKLEVDIAKPHAIDVEVTILNMLYADRESAPLYDGGTVTSPITITSGDVVNIWYRGYLIGDDGEPIVVSGMSNFGSASPTSLAIGSNSFIPGFEYNMIGKNTGDYSKFNKITEGEITDGLIVYVSYSRVKGTDATTKISQTNERIVLSEDIDATYGAGFKDKLLSLTIGGDKTDFKTEIGESSYAYTDFKVNFATDCETNPMVVECYFPYDYGQANLRNETAYFEVYVDGVVVYDCPEFTDEYLQKKIEDKEINITLEKLNGYDGNTLTEKYRDFATKSMNEIYEETYQSMLSKAFWAKINEVTKAKKYPEKEVQAVYDGYVDDFSMQFINDGGQVVNSTTGQTQTYDTLDSYISASLGLGSTVSWQDYIYSQSEKAIKERIAIYYILRNENLVPDEATFKADYAAIEQEFIDEAIDQYLYYAGETKEDLTAEELKAVTEECREMVYTNFDETFFTIRTYYRTIDKVIGNWCEVSTLDNRRAYPQDK